MSNSITGINNDIISAGVLDGFTAGIAPIMAFCTNFSSDAAQRGGTVKVPRMSAATAAATKSSGNYTIQDLESDSVTITLGQPKYVSGALDDVEVHGSSVLGLEMYGRQKGFQLAKAVLQDIWSCVTAANFGSAAFTGAAATFDADDVVDIAQVCDTANMPEDMRALVIKETYFANLLKDGSIQSSAAFGGSEAVRENKIPRLAGFDLYKSTLIPSNSENLVGFAAHPSAIAVAMRYLAPQDGNKYSRAEAITDPKTGITIGLREWYDENSGQLRRVWECQYGYAVGVAAGIKRLVSA